MTSRSRQVARIASWVAVRTAHARATKRRSESKSAVTSYEPPLPHLYSSYLIFMAKQFPNATPVRPAEYAMEMARRHYEPPSIDPIFPHEIIYHEPLVPVEARCGYSTPQDMLTPLVAYLMGAAVGAIIVAWVWLLWQIVCAVCEWIWG